jgi:hypothetical protein
VVRQLAGAAKLLPAHVRRLRQQIALEAANAAAFDDTKEPRGEHLHQDPDFGFASGSGGGVGGGSSPSGRGVTPLQRRASAVLAAAPRGAIVRAEGLAASGGPSPLALPRRLPRREAASSADRADGAGGSLGDALAAMGAFSPTNALDRTTLV